LEKVFFAQFSNSRDTTELQGSVSEGVIYPSIYILDLGCHQ